MMKIKTAWSGFLVITFFVAISCVSKNKNPNELILNSIEAHGGLNEFRALQNVALKKKSTVYDSVGKVKSSIIQNQQFFFEEGALKKTEIYFIQKKDTIKLNLEEGKATKRVNDSLVLDKGILEAARNTLNGASFVFFQPFLINNSIATKKYLGQTTVADHLVNIVEIKYPNSDDQWLFYFSVESQLLIGYRVLHNNRYSLIINEQMQAINGFQLVSQRSSYFVDSLNTIKRKVAEYAYKIVNLD